MSDLFTYKPAPISAPVTFRVEPGRLRCETQGWTVEYAAVTRAAWVEHRLRGQRMVRLDLWDDGNRRSLAVNLPEHGFATNPDAQSFVSLVRQVLNGLGAAQPGVKISVGEAGVAQIVFFLIGLGSFLGGVTLLAAVIASGVGSDRLASAALPLGVLTLFGAGLAWSFRPWKKAPETGPARLEETLAAEFGPA